MTASAQFERSPNHWNDEDNTAYIWRSTYPIAITYDLASRKAYASEGVEQWYFITEDVKYYAKPFETDLKQMTERKEDVVYWWAVWVLEGAPPWKDFCKRHGTVYEEPERDRG